MSNSMEALGEQEALPQQDVAGGGQDNATVEGASLTPSAVDGPSFLDKAAHDYKTLIPQFYKCIDTFSKKQLHRIIEALIEYPLESDYPHLPFENEKQAFYLGMHIFDCKNLMLREALELTKNKEKLAQFQVELEKLAKEKGEMKS